MYTALHYRLRHFAWCFCMLFEIMVYTKLHGLGSLFMDSAILRNGYKILNDIKWLYKNLKDNGNQNIIF